MAARVRYNWGAIMSSRAARRAALWIRRAQEGAPSPQAPLAPEEIDGMMAACRKRLEANPDNVYAMMSMGCHLVYVGRHREAILLLDRLIGLEPGNRLAHAQRGAALLELGMYGDALEAFVRAQAGSPTTADSFNIGITLGLLGRKSEAGRVIEAAIERDPKGAGQSLLFCDAHRALDIHGARRAGSIP